MLTRLAVLGSLAIALIGCAGSETPTPSATATVTVTETVAPSFVWPTSTADVTGGPGESPEFPKSLDGWRPDESWNFTVRAFEGSWSEGTWGNNWTDWEATMNGCNRHMVLLRWRSLADEAPVVAGWTYSGNSANSVPSASKGWMALDGCATPRWSLATSYDDGANLVDLTVDAQIWLPAP